ncbi:hypothetical protein ACQP7A_13550 [Acinetobacter baumannii]|uniref:hypothetical protein n=1 Tax=Acinetobacter baumannii TaxID=470 RepID=UPI003CFE35BC
MQTQSNNTQYLQDIEHINELILKNYKKFFQVFNNLQLKLNSHISKIENEEKFEYLLVQQRSVIISDYDKLTTEINYVERLIKGFNFSNFSESIKDNFSQQLNSILHNLSTIEDLINSFTEIADRVGYKILEPDGNHAEASQHTNYTKELVNKLIPICGDIQHFTTDTLYLFKNIGLLVSNNINKDLSKTEIEFYERFKDEISLLVKKYNNEISNLTQIYENKIKNYELDLDKLRKSSELLISGVDAGLKNSNELNEKTQNLELFFSTIINEKKSKIDEELEAEKNKISINIKDVKEALFAEEKTIRAAHKDFLTLVGNAGIYKLTENYHEKAKDEKKEYKRFRRYTSYSLIAAIVSTFLIFIWALYDKPDTTYNFMIYLWQPESSNKIDYFLLLSRLSISLMFFVLAYYLSKQASKHYECYQENHRTFLQLAALEPFMVKMNEDEQKIIRKGLIPTYFNQNADGKFASAGEEIGFPSSITSPIEKLAEVLKPIIDKAVDKGSDSSKP